MATPPEEEQDPPRPSLPAPPSPGLTRAVVEAEVHAVVDDHQGAPCIALGVVGSLAVADQGQGVLHHVLRDGRGLRRVLRGGGGGQVRCSCLLPARGKSLPLGTSRGFPGGSERTASTCTDRPGFDPWAGKIPWRRARQPTPVFLPGESRGQRSLGATVHGVAKRRTGLSDFTRDVTGALLPQ